MSDNPTREEHEREISLDERENLKICSECGGILRVDHGIVHINQGHGVTWWKCPDCKTRFKEQYQVEFNPDKKTSLSMEVI